MKVVARELFIHNGARVRPGTVIDWDDKKPVPPCCDVVDAVKERQKPGPKRKEPRTFAEINDMQTADELKPWAAAKGT